jgi:hypothetical protein
VVSLADGPWTATVTLLGGLAGYLAAARLVLAALATLGVVGALVPRIGNLRPPWSESPSGLLVIGARLLGLGAMAAAAGPMTQRPDETPVHRSRMDRISTTGPTMQVLA